MLEAIERELLDDYSRTLRWNVRDELLNLAAALVFRRTLRTLDSLQLASALQVKQFLGHEDDLLFIASDHRLLACAVAEGLETWDPESGPPPVNFMR